MRTRALLPWATAAMVATVATRLHAEPAPPTADRDAANVLFEEGRALMAAGQIPEACQRFADSLAVVRRLGVLMNLADCHERLGNTATASALFDDAAAMAEASTDGRAVYASARRKALAPRLIRATVVVEHAPPGLAIRWNGDVVRASTYRTPRPVDPGVHRVTASAPGYRTRELEVTARTDGANLDVRVPGLEPLARDPAPLTLAVMPTSSRGKARLRPIAFWTSAGIGVTSLVAGSALGWSARSLWQRARSRCTDEGRCDDAGERQLHRARGHADLSTIACAVGGVAVTVAAVLHLTRPVDRPTATRLTPMVTGNAALLTLDGHF